MADEEVICIGLHGFFSVLMEAESIHKYNREAEISYDML